MDSFTDLCTPAQVYVILTALSLIAMIFAKQYGPAVVKLIFAFIFTFVLNWLCSKGYSSLSWFIVLVPFILMGLAFIILLFGLKQIAKASNQQQDQHPQSQHQQAQH
jgi:predicted PurR-regulated permease PerM